MDKLACLLCLLPILACGAAKAADDRDRGLSDAPIAADGQGEPLRGDLAVGVGLYKDEDLDGAEAAFHKHLEANPKSAAAHYQLGLIAQDRGKMDDARSEFEQAFKLNPQLHGAASNLGAIYLEAGEDIAALKVLEQAAALAPDDPRVLANLGAARLRRGLWSAGVEAYKLAVKQAPGHGTLLYNLALAFMERYQWQAALQALDEAVAARPRFALARAARVVCLQGLGQLDDAETYARDSLKELPKPIADNHVVLGRVLLAKRRASDAQEAFEDALELDKDSAVAQLALAELLDATGKKAKAAELYAAYAKNPRRHPDEARRARDRLDALREVKDK